jgi:hypothetical protein
VATKGGCFEALVFLVNENRGTELPPFLRTQLGRHSNKALTESKSYMHVSMHAPTGRYEKRTPRAVPVDLLHLDESQLNVRTVTENVSPRGVRIVTDWNCAPGKRVLLTAPEEGVKSLARVVYCHPLESTKFAVGLQLVVRVEEWGELVS